MTSSIRCAVVGIALAVAIAAVTAIGQAAQHAGSKKSAHSSIPTWSPNPKLLSKLAPEHVEQGYGLRPVTDYIYNSETHNGNDTYEWQGDPRADDTAPLLAMIIGDMPPDSSAHYSTRDVLSTYIQDMQQNLTNLEFSTQEAGRIGKQQFIRVRWTGNEPSQKAPTRGFLYVTTFPKQFVILAGQDRLSHSDSTLPLLNAACQTFRKK